MPHVNVAVPVPKSKMALVNRSVPYFGSRSATAGSEAALSQTKARQTDGVATNVHQTAPTPLLHMPNVVWIIVEIGKERVNGLKRTNRTLPHPLSRLLPLRMVPIHERFHTLQSRILLRHVVKRWPSALLRPIGFSHSTCLPDCSA